MIMADVFKILFLILGMLACTMSYWLVFQALFAGKVEQGRMALLARPYRTFMTGGLVGLPLFLLGFTMMANGAGPLLFLGGAIMVALTLLALFGSTGLVLHIGEQLRAKGAESHPGASVLRGGAVFSIACVLPVVGWFFVIPVALIMGFGVSVRTLWSRKAVSVAAPAVNAVQA